MGTSKISDSCHVSQLVDGELIRDESTHCVVAEIGKDRCRNSLIYISGACCRFYRYVYPSLFNFSCWMASRTMIGKCPHPCCTPPPQFSRAAHSSMGVPRTPCVERYSSWPRCVATVSVASGLSIVAQNIAQAFSRHREMTSLV